MSGFFMRDRVRMDGIPEKYIGQIKHKPVFGTVIGFDLHSVPQRIKVEWDSETKKRPVSWVLSGQINKVN